MSSTLFRWTVFNKLLEIQSLSGILYPGIIGPIHGDHSWVFRISRVSKMNSHTPRKRICDTMPQNDVKSRAFKSVSTYQEFSDIIDVAHFLSVGQKIDRISIRRQASEITLSALWKSANKVPNPLPMSTSNLTNSSVPGHRYVCLKRKRTRKCIQNVPERRGETPGNVCSFSHPKWSLSTGFRRISPAPRDSI